MPNWALNRLYISGDDNLIEEFVKASTIDGKFSFSGIVPEPEYKDDKEWYNWRHDNWGTKSDIDDDIFLVEQFNNCRTYSFNTAWGGPYEWLRAVAKKFPELSFRMYSADPAMDWHTECLTRNGKLYMNRDTFENNIQFWEDNDAVFQF